MLTEHGLTKVAEGVFELRLPIPFEDGLVNVFLFADGDEADLLDCGMNSDESVATIKSAIAGIGAKRLRKLVITHIHPDHYGAAGSLAGEGMADLYIHRLEVPLVHPRYVELEQLVKEVRTYLLVNGVPADDAEVLSNSQRALSQVVKTAEPSVQLDGAELLQMGRRRLRVEWTPGHSPGHICLYDRKDRLLFAGDHMLPELSPNIGLHPQSTPDPLHEYLDGLRRLAAYEPELILPSHGRPFTDAPARVKVLEAHHKKRLEQIVAIVGRGKETGWEVALELWGPRANLYEKRLALQEALAHLQALAVDSRVSKSSRPPLCAGRPLDSEGQQLRRVAADTHHPGSGVSAYNRSQGLDHQRLGDRIQLSADPLRVRFRVGVADDHANTVASIDVARELDDSVQRSVERAHAFERGDQPVADAQDRLHLQHRPDECACIPDPSPATQEFERGDREVSLNARSHLENLGFNCSSVLSARRERGSRQGDEP